MMVRVLVVCTANVCRSRVAQELLREALAGAGVPAVVGSAGVRAPQGAPACGTMVRLLRERGLGIDEAEGSRPVTADLLAAQHLVLVAERAHRAAVARLLPSVRPRTFTVLEGAALADALPEDRLAGPPDQRVLTRVGWMNRARGKVELPIGPVRRGLSGVLRVPAQPLDVPDVHGGSLRDHRRALDRLEDGVTRVVRGLAG